jgi:hypothetical protein
MQAFINTILAALVLMAAADPPQKTDKPSSRPADDIDYWLRRGKPVEEKPSAPAEAGNPFKAGKQFRRPGALPGVVELSDGKRTPGGISTTPGKDWIVWVEEEKRWRHIPPAAVLSISVKMVKEEMVLEWRWKAMGEPEKVYTGRKYPLKRFLWTLHLADGSRITGAIKGQPLWIEPAGGGERQAQLLILHERLKGKIGEKLEDLVHPKRIIISRRVMEQVTQAENQKQQ